MLNEQHEEQREQMNTKGGSYRKCSDGEEEVNEE